MNLENKIEVFIKKLQEKNIEDIILLLKTNNVVLTRYANNEIMIPIINSDSLLTISLGYKKRRLITEINDIYFDPNQLSENLIKMLNQLEEQEVYVNLPKEKFQYPNLLEPDEETIKAEEKSIDYVDEIINESLNKGVKRVAGTLEIAFREVKLWNSNGLYLEDKRSIVMLNHRCFLDSTSTGQWSYTSRSLKDLNWKLVVDKASEICKNNVNHKKVEAGKYKAVLAPMIFASLIEHIAQAASAYAVETGFSYFIGKLGKKIGSDIITIIDDPLNEKSGGYTRFDDEGIPTRRKEIISKGILTTYLHNLTTAKKFNTETTGNAGLISPHPWSLHVEAGDYDEQEILKELKRGLFIVNNWYLRFQNYQLGDFSTILRDGIFLVEDGEIKQALLGARLTDNFLNLLSNIKGLTKNIYPIKWWEVNTPTYVPYALIENVNITTAE